MGRKELMFIGLVVIVLFVIIKDIIKSEKNSKLSLYMIMNSGLETINSANTKSELFNNQKFLQLNKEIAENKKRNVEKLISEIEKGELTRDDKVILYDCVLNYFTLLKDKNKSEKYYKKLIELCSEDEKQNVDAIYNTRIEKGYKYIDETLNKIENARGKKKVALESLLSEMYENKGVKYLAKEYKQKAAEDFRIMTFGDTKKAKSKKR